MNTKLDFDEINDAFVPYDQLESASFVQGMLVGLLSSEPSMTEPEWIKRLLDEAGVGAIKESFLAVLHQLYHDTLKGLNDASCDLELYLPVESSRVETRLNYLSHWCEGFLYGMGLGEVEDDLSREVQEVLSDFADISIVELPELDEDELEDAEADFMELNEFVRMAAVMVYDELNPVERQPIPMGQMDKQVLH